MNEAVAHIEEMHMETVELDSHVVPDHETGGVAATLPIFSSDMFAEEGDHEYDEVDDAIIMDVRLWATDDRWGATINNVVQHEFAYPVNLSADDAVNAVEHFVDEELHTLVYAMHEEADEMLDLARSAPRVAVLIAEIAPIMQKIYDAMMEDDLDD